MKTRIEKIKELHHKAFKLLKAAEDMGVRIENLKNYETQLMTFGNVPKLAELWNDIDTCERGQKRLLYSYQKCLTQILEI